MKARIPGRNRSQKRRWTEAELLSLRREWHALQYRGLRQKFPGRSWCSIHAKAVALGLPRGVPQGRLSVRAAAAQLGLCEKTLVRLCAARGVAVHTTYPGPTPKRTRRPRKGEVAGWTAPRTYVDPDEAREALAWWERTETPWAAAVRTGVAPAVLWRWLVAAGKIAPTKDGVRRRHRVEPDVVDQIVNQHRARHRAHTERAAA